MKCEVVDYAWGTDMSVDWGTAKEKDDVKAGKQKVWYEHTCVNCVAQEEGIGLADAARLIKQKPTDKMVARVKSYEHAMNHVQETFNFLGFAAVQDDVDMDGASSSPAPPAAISNRQRKMVMRGQARMKITGMKQLFGPVLWILKLKSEDMDEAALAARKFQAWMRGDTKFEDYEQDAKVGDALQIEFEDAVYKERAFASKADPIAMRLAADYSDQWFSHDSGAFNVFYVCMAGGLDWECCTLIESLKWDRLHADPAATKQRWYCWCEAKYMTKFGVLCEIVSGDKCLYCRAELPPHDLQDAKGMMIESKFKEANTPQELLDAIPKISPMERGSFFKPMPGKDGHYRADRTIFKSLPKLDWNQLYNLNKV